jgi:hypothetical protein
MKNYVIMPLSDESATLLHKASWSNHIQTVRTVVDLGTSCDIQDANGKTLLHVSAETGSLEVAKFIVKRQEMYYAEVVLKYVVTLDGVIKKLSRECFDRTGNWSCGAGHRGENSP